ncbi:MAG TPA: CBS domain-containing protein [Woeseiaceae bacterium]|nr:CBS domain-containing protein [Woeseiaceae bacterium]
MDTVQDVLDSENGQIWTIESHETVFDAIQKMAQQDIGSLVVMEGSAIAGIFTERHYAREVFLKGRRSPTTPIREVMSTNVICALPERTIDECMALMSDKHIRHLPIVEDETLVGIVSMGDLVRSKIADQKFVIDQLINYIHG